MRTFTRLVLTAILPVAAFPVSAARASIYRCVQDDGHISYQQIRCHSEDQPLEIKRRQSGWSPLRPGEQALLDGYRRKDLAQRRKPRAKRKKSVKESRSCWSRRKQLEAVRAKLHNGYKLKEDEPLHRKRKNYEDYLRQFCS